MHGIINAIKNNSHFIYMNTASMLAPSAYQVLLVEDDDTISHLIRDGLSGQGYQIDHCAEGDQGLEQALQQPYHLVLLDLMLPKLNGLELLRKLKAVRQRTPVIVISACAEQQDRIAGLHYGADDYLPKPFCMEELLLRVQAVLRRCYQEACLATHHVLQVGPVSVDKRARRVYIDPRAVGGQESQYEMETLTPAEFELLWYLMLSPDEVHSREYLYQAVLHRNYAQYDRSLDVHVSNLRSKLRACLPGQDWIITVRGKGYRLW